MHGIRNLKFAVSLAAGLFFFSTMAQTAVSTSTGGNIAYLPFVTRPVEYWINHYGDDSHTLSEVATGIIPTQDGGLLLMMEQGSSPSKDPQDDFVLVKVSATGSILWQKGLGNFDVPDFYLEGEETSDGGFIFSGLSQQSGTNGAQVFKTNANGDIQWQRNFGGADFDYARSIQQTADGGYVFTGYTASYGSALTNLWLVRLAPDGSTQWQKTAGLSAFQFGSALDQTSDGGYVVTGQAAAGTGIYDLWVVKFVPGGSVSWQKRYGGSEQDYGRDILQTVDGGYLVAGLTESAGAGGSDGWLIKLNSSGDVVWQKSYGGGGDDWFNAIYPTNDGRFLVAGTTGSFGAGETDTWLLLVDGSGSIIWQKSYGSSDEETGDFVRQLANGKILVGGYTASYGSDPSDAWVLKVDSDGNIANCNLIGTSAAVAANTALSSLINPLSLSNSQANAFNSVLPAINANIQMTPLCTG